jgi:hypothetical protein
MPKEHTECRPAHTQKLPGREAPSQGKSTGAVRSSHDAYQGERKEQADPAPRKPAQ